MFETSRGNTRAGRFRKRVILANVPSFRCLFRVNIRQKPSCLKTPKNQGFPPCPFLVCFGKRQETHQRNKRNKDFVSLPNPKNPWKRRGKRPRKQGITRKEKKQGIQIKNKERKDRANPRVSQSRHCHEVLPGQNMKGVKREVWRVEVKDEEDSDGQELSGCQVSRASRASIKQNPSPQ